LTAAITSPTIVGGGNHMRILASFALVAVLGFAVHGHVSAAAAAPFEPMTKGDRQRLLAHLDMTEQWLASEIAGLTPAQLTFRMTPDSWSITDVVEHLSIAEPQYWQMVADSMKQNEVAGKNDTTDAAILWYGIDRTERTKTGEARVPQGKVASAQEAFATFRKLRATIREFAATTQEDLRARRLQGGGMQIYQAVLMISSHAQRHILQVQEIKAHGKYPKG
jgi:hypothetical protein